MSGSIPLHRAPVERLSGSGTLIATLPAGFRPSGPAFFATYGSLNTLATIVIGANGGVSYSSGDTSFISLEGVTFRTEQ